MPVFNFCQRFWVFGLTAILLVRGAIVIAVVDTIANIVLANTAAVVAGELCAGVTRPKQTAHLVTVVPTVVVVVTAVVVGHTSPIPTGKHCRFTRVEGCQLQ